MQGWRSERLVGTDLCLRASLQMTSPTRSTIPETTWTRTSTTKWMKDIGCRFLSPTPMVRIVNFP